MIPADALRAINFGQRRRRLIGAQAGGSRGPAGAFSAHCELLLAGALGALDPELLGSLGEPRGSSRMTFGRVGRCPVVVASPQQSRLIVSRLSACIAILSRAV